jgi:uncharacterized protein YjdB
VALTVSQDIVTIAVTPTGPMALTHIGETSDQTAEATDAGGSTVAGTTFTWSSDNQSAATVAGDGTVTAVGTGTANIRASASNVTSNTILFTIDVALGITSTSLPDGAQTIVYSHDTGVTGGVWRAPKCGTTSYVRP